MVAAGAVDGGGEEDLTHGSHDAIQVVILGEDTVGRIEIPCPQTVESGCDRPVNIPGLELVARKLFYEKMVVGLVLVQGSDDPVAIAPGARLGTVIFKAVGFLSSIVTC